MRGRCEGAVGSQRIDVASAIEIPTEKVELVVCVRRQSRQRFSYPSDRSIPFACNAFFGRLVEADIQQLRIGVVLRALEVDPRVQLRPREPQLLHPTGDSVFERGERRVARYAGAT